MRLTYMSCFTWLNYRHCSITIDHSKHNQHNTYICTTNHYSNRPLEIPWNFYEQSFPIILCNEPHAILNIPTKVVMISVDHYLPQIVLKTVPATNGKVFWHKLLRQNVTHFCLIRFFTISRWNYYINFYPHALQFFSSSVLHHTRRGHHIMRLKLILD